MSELYILAGPAGAGNPFGIFRPNLVPEGRFVVACDDEYANGGAGPCVVGSKLYRRRERAEAAMAELLATRPRTQE